MPVQLNSLVQQWFTQKQVDTDGNGSISREEMAVYTNNASLKPYAQQSWEEALGGQMIKSADGNGGESFFSILSQLDGVAGLSELEVGKLASLDGNSADITGADFKNFNLVSDPKPVADYKLNYEGHDYTVTEHSNGSFTAKVGDEDLPIALKDDGTVVLTANGENHDLGKLKEDGDGTYSIEKVA